MVKPFSQSKVQALKCTLCPQLGGPWAWFEVKLNFLLSVTHVVDCALYVHDIFVASIKSILIKRPSGMSGGPIISYWGNLAATNLPFPSSTLKTTQFSFFDIQTPWPCIDMPLPTKLHQPTSNPPESPIMSGHNLCSAWQPADPFVFKIIRSKSQWRWINLTVHLNAPRPKWALCGHPSSSINQRKFEENPCFLLSCSR